METVVRDTPSLAATSAIVTRHEFILQNGIFPNYDKHLDSQTIHLVPALGFLVAAAESVAAYYEIDHLVE
jgi:hypothetical protein